jgi:hypothetical protein
LDIMFSKKGSKVKFLKKYINLLGKSQQLVYILTGFYFLSDFLA